MTTMMYSEEAKHSDSHNILFLTKWDFFLFFSVCECVLHFSLLKGAGRYCAYFLKYR